MTDSHERKHTACLTVFPGHDIMFKPPVITLRASVVGVLLQHSSKALRFSKKPLAVNQKLILGSSTGCLATRHCMEVGYGLLFNPASPSPAPKCQTDQILRYRPSDLHICLQALFRSRNISWLPSCSGNLSFRACLHTSTCVVLPTDSRDNRKSA